jgi:hypothetical protein
MKLRFLNTSGKHQRFHYNPMYYDERKERLDKKKELYRKMHDGALSTDERREMFKDNLRENWSRTDIRGLQHRKANLRVILLILIIVALGYFIFNGIDEVDTVVKNLW